MTLSRSPLRQAYDLDSKVAQEGFDWDSPLEAANKIREELEEILEELHKEYSPTQQNALEDEMGDLFLACVTFARHCHVDPEEALKKGLEKFRERYARLKNYAKKNDISLHEASADQLSALWQSLKKASRNANIFFATLPMSIGLLSLGFLSSATADQFLTNTPQTLEHMQKRVYISSAIAKATNQRTIVLPGIEYDLGLLPDFQSYFVVPIVQSKLPMKHIEYGYGDVRLGFKYRFIHETNTIPQVAFYPIFTFPSGDPDRGLGNGGSLQSLPLWLQKSWGQWTLSGGGGYTFNHAPLKFNFFSGGALLRRYIGDRWMLGGEFYLQGATSLVNHSSLILNFGGHYIFTPNLACVFSSGHSIAGKKFLVGYIGFRILWGPGTQ
ncbi:MAG: transporter [Alphaproteobacteria bacterium]|nr:transporter [Alphaproteobacteria bacterium]